MPSNQTDQIVVSQEIMGADHFNRVYSAALKEDIETLKKNTQFINVSCLTRKGRMYTPPQLLASEQKHKAVQRLLTFGASRNQIAEGYAEARDLMKLNQLAKSGIIRKSKLLDLYGSVKRNELTTKHIFPTQNIAEGAEITELDKIKIMSETLTVLFDCAEAGNKALFDQVIKCFEELRTTNSSFKDDSLFYKTVNQEGKIFYTDFENFAELVKNFASHGIELSWGEYISEEILNSDKTKEDLKKLFILAAIEGAQQSGNQTLTTAFVTTAVNELGVSQDEITVCQLKAYAESNRIEEINAEIRALFDQKKISLINEISDLHLNIFLENGNMCAVHTLVKNYEEFGKFYPDETFLGEELEEEIEHKLHFILGIETLEELIWRLLESRIQNDGVFIFFGFILSACLEKYPGNKEIAIPDRDSGNTPMKDNIERRAARLIKKNEGDIQKGLATEKLPFESPDAIFQPNNLALFLQKMVPMIATLTSNGLPPIQAMEWIINDDLRYFIFLFVVGKPYIFLEGKLKKTFCFSADINWLIADFLAPNISRDDFEALVNYAEIIRMHKTVEVKTIDSSSQSMALPTSPQLVL